MTGRPEVAVGDVLRVAHSFEVWLPLTMTWAYTMVRQAGGVQALVLAGETANLEQFPWQPLVTPRTHERAAVRAAWRMGIVHTPRSYHRALAGAHTQLVHSHFGYRGWGDLSLVARAGARHVVTFYGHDVTMFPRRWPEWLRRYRELFAAADLVLCEGPFMAGTIQELGCSRHKVRVQRLGVDVERLECRPRSLGAGEPVRVLVAGAFREKKNIPGALRALAAARDAGHDLVATVVGGSSGSPSEEAERLRIERTVKETGLGDLVTFTGLVPYARLVEEVRRHHLYLAPSITAANGDSEGGCPVTVIEAAATGMPVIGSTHCDIPQVVEHGVTGLLAAEGDQQALDRALCELLEHPERWPQMGDAAGRLARERFDARQCAGELAETYRLVMAGGAGAQAPAPPAITQS
jgi:colanic acid/amylovoran biosynthesis glycosyltransferase